MSFLCLIVKCIRSAWNLLSLQLLLALTTDDVIIPSEMLESWNMVSNAWWISANEGLSSGLHCQPANTQQNMNLHNDQNLHWSSKAWGLYFLLYIFKKKKTYEVFWISTWPHDTVTWVLKMDKLNKKASKVLGQMQRHLYDLNVFKAMQNVSMIIQDVSHALHGEVQLLPSGRQPRVMKKYI